MSSEVAPSSWGDSIKKRVQAALLIQTHMLTLASSYTPGYFLATTAD